MTSPYAGDRAADIGAAPAPAEPAPAQSDPESATAAARSAAAARGQLGGGPVLPEQSPEDTDAAWGEYPQSRDDDHLYRDRPPHWDDF